MVRFDCLGRICVGGVIVGIAFFSSIPSVSAQSETKKDPKVTYKVISAEGGGYGYDVYVDGRKLIHQPNIPGQPGVAGFKKKEDSQRVAELVIKKIKNKEMPPSVTTEELRQLKVID